MAHCNVSNFVALIMGSFSNSIDLCKKLRGNGPKRKRSRMTKSLDAEELRLTKSLRQGHEDIGREYQKNMQASGMGFAVGDVLAQTSLAEILLKINAGLVGIIASFLRQDKKTLLLDYQSLVDLSEQSRIETCRSLRQLRKRMTSSLSGDSTLSVSHTSDRVNRPRRTGSRRPVPKHSSIRRPTLARVTVLNSSQPSQIALVKPGEKGKKSRTGSGSGTPSALSKAHLASSAQLYTPPPPYEPTDKPSRPTGHRSYTTQEAPKEPRHKHSAMDFNSQARSPYPVDLRATRSTPGLTAAHYNPQDILPPMPTSAPLPGMAPRSRKLTPTYYSIASDSTKLGEIPLHKWTVPFDFEAMEKMNRDAERDGWPIDQFENGGKKTRFGFMKFFKRKTAQV